MRFEAVIFDLWGTLVPFSASTRRASTEAMSRVLATPYEPFAATWAATFDARALGQDLSATVGGVCRTLGLEANHELIDHALRARTAVLEQRFLPREDAVETLSELRRDGRRIALLTDCTLGTPELFAKSALAALVDEPVFSCRERLKKPDPRFYGLACQRLAVLPSECLYVGDGGGDELRGAARLDMKAVLIDPGDTEPPPWDGITVTAIRDVLALVT